MSPNKKQRIADEKEEMKRRFIFCVRQLSGKSEMDIRNAIGDESEYIPVVAEQNGVRIVIWNGLKPSNVIKVHGPEAAEGVRVWNLQYDGSGYYPLDSTRLKNIWMGEESEDEDTEDEEMADVEHHKPSDGSDVEMSEAEEYIELNKGRLTFTPNDDKDDEKQEPYGPGRARLTDIIARQYQQLPGAPALVTVDDMDGSMIRAPEEVGLPRNRHLCIWSLSCSQKALNYGSMGERIAFINDHLPDVNFVTQPFAYGLRMLPNSVGTVDLHTTAYPIAALHILRDFLQSYFSRETYGPIQIFLTFVLQPEAQQLEIMQRRKEAQRDTGGSPFEPHLILFEHSGEDDREELMLILPLLEEQLNSLQLQRIPLPDTNVAATFELDDLHAYLYEDKAGLSMCCLRFAVLPQPAIARQSPRIPPPSATEPYVFHEEVAWDNYGELLYGPIDLAKNVLAYMEAVVGPEIHEDRLKTMLVDFTDPPLVVISKIISVLIPRGPPTLEKVYTDLIVHGQERAGKSAALILPTLVANSPPMRAISAAANKRVRTALAVGPNTRGPEKDALTKLGPSTISGHLSNLQRLTQKDIHLMDNASDIDAYVFGDSDNRAKMLQDMMKRGELIGHGTTQAKIDWLNVIDEASHFFGRGFWGGSYSMSETKWRDIIKRPCVRANIYVDATPGPLFYRGGDRVLGRGGSIQVLRLKRSDTYYGADRLETKYVLANGDSFDSCKVGRYKQEIPDGSVDLYNAAHRCLSAYLNTPVHDCTQEGQQYRVLPIFLIGLTEKVEMKQAGGQKQLAVKLAMGEYQGHEWDEDNQQWKPRSYEREKPVCITYANNIITIFVEIEGEVRVETANNFILRCFPNHSSLGVDDEKAGNAKTMGDSISDTMPLVMEKYGVTRPVFLLGYGRFARLVTVAFKKTFDNIDHRWIVTHAAMKVTMKQKTEEYTRCIESQIQLLRNEENLRREMEAAQEAYLQMATSQAAHVIPNHFFDRFYPQHDLVFSTEERIALHDLYLKRCRPAIDKMCFNFIQNPAAPTSPLDTAMEMFARLFAFNYTWQLDNYGAACAEVPSTFRRQGCVLSVIWFALSDRQLKVGISKNEIICLQRFAGYKADEIDDLNWLTYPSVNKASLVTTSLLEVSSGFLKLGDEFLVRRGEFADLSGSLPGGSPLLKRFLDSCRHHTLSFLRDHAGKVYESLESQTMNTGIPFGVQL
ncbi:hypothetical protein HDV00_000484 [Rhizophlyctis rosea]|nr:hypothetical protein HDV00_000484 [Rhizophlyctis rosea]